MLAGYVEKLDDYYDCAEAYQILTDDKMFAQAVNDYPNVVTHYLAAKAEILFALFMAPVFDVTGGNVSLIIEIAKPSSLPVYVFNSPSCYQDG